MQIVGELIGNYILISKPRNVGKLSSSHFGKMTKDNKLKLNLLEGVFLLDEKKISIFQNDRELDFQNLFILAAKQISQFGDKYLAFRDLRKRGYTVKFHREDKSVNFIVSKKEKDQIFCFVVVFSEREDVSIEGIKKLIQNAEENDNNLWFAIVDEEGDITYYDVKNADLCGQVKGSIYPKGKGFIFKNQVMVFDTDLSESLFNKEFYGKPFGKSLKISMVEALYLARIGVINIYRADKNEKLSLGNLTCFIKKQQPDIELRTKIFEDLKKRGLIVKTGFKFGTHFRVYTKHPDKTHAEYLVHVVDTGVNSSWDELSRAVRLAHSVNKDIIFAQTQGENVDYLHLGRLRP